MGGAHELFLVMTKIRTCQHGNPTLHVHGDQDEIPLFPYRLKVTPVLFISPKVTESEIKVHDCQLFQNFIEEK